MIAFKRPSPSPTGVNTLVIASAGIQLASGFFGTFLSLRVALEHFDPTIAGLVLSSYFAGYTIGALRSQIIIERIGHIRSYVACAGLAVAATSAMPLFTGAMPWIILRGIIGFGCAGLFVTTESWLSCKTEPAERGRIFARYMVGNFIALALGQLLIIQARVETMAPFSGIAALFALSLIIMSMTRAEQPERRPAPRLPYGKLSWTAPVAVWGSALSGTITGAFYALVPAWMQSRGVDNTTIGLFMLAAVLGGLLFQVPVGRFSDRVDRPIVLAILGVGIASIAIALVNLPRNYSLMMTAAAMLGGFMSTVYPVCVAHAHDRMEAEQIVAVSGRLILVYGLGSIMGPFVGMSLMQRFGIDGVLYLMGTAGLLLATVAVCQRLTSHSSSRSKTRFGILAPTGTLNTSDSVDFRERQRPPSHDQDVT